MVVTNLIIFSFKNADSSLIALSFFADKDLGALKQELDMDVHRVDISELCLRFDTDVDRGMTTEAAKRGNVKYGLNALTPPPTTPGIMLGCLYFLCWCFI
jgi:hypothetical protein